MGIFLTTGNLGKIATMGWRRVTIVIGIIGAVATSMDGATFLLQSHQVVKKIPNNKKNTINHSSRLVQTKEHRTHQLSVT